MKALPLPQLCRRLTAAMLCPLCCQGDGYDLCSPLSAGGPDAEGAGGRNPPPDSQNTSAGNRPESIQESPVSHTCCLSGKRTDDTLFKKKRLISLELGLSLWSFPPGSSYYPKMCLLSLSVSCHGLCPRLPSTDSMTSHMGTWSRVGLMNNSCAAFVPAEDCNL